MKREREREIKVANDFSPIILLIGLSILLVSCGQQSEYGLANAQPHFGFTSTSAVRQLDENTFYIGVEAVLRAGFAGYDLGFTLPANRTMVALQGTASHRACCFSQALATVRADDKEYPLIIKLPAGGGAETVFINYSIPLTYTSGNGRVHVEADPEIGCPGVTTWEFQGLLRVQ